MKKMCFALALAAIATVARAEWTEVGNTTEGTNYLDFATIRKTGQQVKVWSLFDYKSAKKNKAGLPYLSQKQQKIFFCDEETSEGTALVVNSGSMGSGDVVFSTTDPGPAFALHPISPDSVEWTILKILCSK